MSTETIEELVVNLTDDDHFNNIRDALVEDIVPRNSDGEAEDLAADLGETSLPWLSINVTAGWFCGGMIFPWYDYDGLLPKPHGYMEMNGDVVSRENYNIQHRTDASDETDYWELYVRSSPHEGLELKDMHLRFLKGTTSATEDGESTPTVLGNADNTIDLTHNHSSPITSSTVTPSLIDDDVGGVNISAPSEANASGHNHTLTLPNNLTSTYDVTPPSIRYKYLFRIVE